MKQNRNVYLCWSKHAVDAVLGTLLIVASPVEMKLGSFKFVRQTTF